MSRGSGGEPSMSCMELVELVTEYLEETLPAVDHSRIEAHLAQCHGCAAYVDQLRLTIRLAGRSRRNSPLPQRHEHVLDAFRDWRRKRASPGRSSPTSEQ